MKKKYTLILFPSAYDTLSTVDSEYEVEFNSIKNGIDLSVGLFNYDDFISGSELKLNIPIKDGDIECIYRGWMMNPKQYKRFYNDLSDKFNIKLVNTPEEYDNCHLFPSSYLQIKDYTPKSVWLVGYEIGTPIDFELISSFAHEFMIKDYVKSVKGHKFNNRFKNPILYYDLVNALETFVKLRGDLYTGGIVLKEFVDLKKYGDYTNEYRVFYFNHEIISCSPNSNQTVINQVPSEFVDKFKYTFDSNFYTVDFAELKSGKWIILEYGDGQVSGLSPNQNSFEFYNKLKNNLTIN